MRLICGMSDGLTDQPEGATPIDDVSGLLQDITTRGELNDAEGLNIVTALDWIDKGRVDDLFAVQFYRELHTKMYDQVWAWAGSLRSQTGEITHPGSRPEAVGQDLGRVAMEFHREWEALKDNTPLLPFISRYHHALVLVHPFNNGNGRWSRLAADAVLQRLAGEPPLIWATDTLVADSDGRKEYFAALRAADAGDFQPLLNYLVALNPGR